MEVVKEGSGRLHDCTGKGNGGDGCGSTLSIIESDIFYTSRNVMREGTDYFLTIKCPRCGSLTDIEERAYKPDYPSQREWEAGARKVSASEESTADEVVDDSSVILFFQDDYAVAAVARIMEYMILAEDAQFNVGGKHITGNAYGIEQRLKLARRSGVTSIEIEGRSKLQICGLLTYFYGADSAFHDEKVFSS